jgi:RNA binding exosome subunit
VEIFVQPDESLENIRERFLSLFPFDLKEEKIKLYEKSALGFNKKIIKVLRVDLLKNRHINAFLNDIFTHLGEKTKQAIKLQAEKRLDNNFNFYLRFDKEMFLEKNALKLTQRGDCIYIRFKVAAFPKKEATALNIIYQLLEQ